MPTRWPSPRRCLTLAALLVVPPAAVFAADPGLVHAAGLDVWNAPALRRELATQTEFGRQLDAVDEDVLARIEVKEALVADLIAGRATLEEVTSQFVALNSVRPEHLDAIRATFPGATEEERMARNVIAYALPRVRDKAARAELARRLDAELRQMLADGPATE